MAKDLTLSMQNRPGTFAEAAEALGNAGVNIEGGAGFATGSEGVVHILVDDAASARRALEQAGVEVKDEKDVVLVDMLANRPGSLGEFLRRISSAGVNLEALYATADGRIAIVADDADAVRRATQGASARA